MKRKLLALLLAATMCTGFLSGCNETPETSDTTTTTTTPANSDEAVTTEGGTEETTGTVNDTPLVISQSDEFNQKFTSFFVANASDQDVLDLVELGIFGVDRAGEIVYKGIDGETRSYNGTDYTYHGPANISVDINETTGETKYNFKIREDLKFSDGKPITADDIIFSLYVYCDPTYDGSATISSLPIKGLKNYVTQTTDEVYSKYEAIAAAALEAGINFEGESADFTAEQFENFYTCYASAWIQAIQNIVDACNGSYLNDEYAAGIGKTADEIKADANLQVAFGMAMWGFGELNEAGDKFVGAATGTEWDLSTTFPTLEDYFNECFAAYEGSLEAFAEVELVDPDTENPVGDAINAFINTFGSTDEAMGGEGVKSISGIQKLNQYEVEVTLTKYDAAAIYRMGIPISPLHYYGDETLYNYEDGSFGFTRGDLSAIHAKDSAHLGGGAYKFVKYENKIVYLEANPYYYDGEPKIKNIQYKESQDADIISGIVSGAIDLGEPSVSKERIAEIKAANPNGETKGEVLDLNPVDYLGYGYIGLNAKNVSIGGVPDSDASKNLRKALATVLAVYRDLTVDSFYGDIASVINYPISNTSWAAPQKTDADYRVAYSTDVNGNDIYTSDMDADARYAAAKTAALGFLEAAGYTVTDGKVTAAPEGGAISFEITVPANGAGDHPSFALITSAKATLAEIGITLEINDVVDGNILWSALDAETQQLWCAAWSATPDPDMYQLYYSGYVVGPGSTGSNRYHVVDPTLDDYMLKARESTDNAYRKEVYKDCFDIILDWSVEIPVYQRKNMMLFSSERINLDTMTPDLTTYWTWKAEIDKLEMK